MENIQFGESTKKWQQSASQMQCYESDEKSKYFKFYLRVYLNLKSNTMYNTADTYLSKYNFD